MSEYLGSALMEIRTDDGTFYQDVNRAEGAAEKLGTTMDRTSAQTDRLGDEMQQTAGQSKQLEQALVRQRARGRENVQSLGAQRAGMQQLSFQIGDIATMYSLGARPSQIFASQIGQVTQAVQLMTGGTSRLAAFLGGPWGIALTAGTIVLAPFVSKLFEAEDAFEAAELASDKFSDAQTILGRVIDLNTGKLKDQAEATTALARAQLILARETARGQQAQAAEVLGEFEGRQTRTMGSRTGFLPETQLPTVVDPVGQIVEMFEAGGIGADFAIRQLEGRITSGGADDPALQAMAAIANSNVASRNFEAYDSALRALNGDEEALQGFLRPGRGSTSRGPTQSEVDADFEGDLATITQRILGARQDIATNAEERAELERRQVEWTRRESLAEIEANEDYSALQKAELAAATTRLADAEQEAITFNMRRELESDALAMLQQRFQDEQDALQVQLGLATTENERKDLALQLLDAEEAYLRQRLLSVILSETANDAERERAEVALAAIRSTSADRRASVALANETTLDRYLRDLNRTPEEINEAINAIQIDGLDTLNNGIVDAVRGVRSLGDVFSSVADQIIADLLRIAIQQAVIGPIANSLFGASPQAGLLGSVNSLFSGEFAGFFAEGGTIPTGQFGIVGENGPEPVFATSGGVGVLPNSSLRAASGGGSAEVTIYLGPGLEADLMKKSAGQTVRIIEAVGPDMVQAASNVARRDAARPVSPGGVTG